MPATSSADERAELRRELRRAARILGGTLAVLWIVLVVDMMLGGALREFGIVPRTVTGLRGIAFAPFLHGGFWHLLANSIGLLAWGTLVLFREESHFWTVTAIGALVGGFATWALGRSAVHIGASGVLFAYFGYLLLAGFFERRIGSILLSTLVAVVWGGMVLGVLPGQPGISWEGHLFGFASGALAARLLARPKVR